MGAGRPTKFREDLMGDAKLLAGLGFTEENLCTYWDISPRTLARWKKRNSELCQAIKKGKMNATISVTKSVYNQALRGNMTASIFWLTNQAPELWQDRRNLVKLNQQITTGQGDVQVTNEMETAQIRQVVKTYSPEQKKTLIATLRGMERSFEGKKEKVIEAENVRTEESVQAVVEDGGVRDGA